MPVRLYVSGDSDGSQGVYFGIATFGSDEDVSELLKDLPVELTTSSKVSSVVGEKVSCAIRSAGGCLRGAQTITRMVLTAVVEVVTLLADGTEAVLFTDNEFICSAINKEWTTAWRRRDWHYVKSGAKVENVHLWTRLLDAKKRKRITFRMVESDFDSKMLDFVNRVMESSLDE